MRSFEQNYAKHIYYDAARDIMDLIEFKPDYTLSYLNEKVIRKAAKKLGIDVNIHRSGDLNIKGSRSTRLISICEHFGAEEYLSPMGSADYLSEDGFTENTATSLKFQKFDPQPYLQRGCQEFISHLSIVDVVANLGWDNASHYISRGVFNE